ncbi:MAG: glycosyltransferase family 2 protein [Gemmatimonadaceae bacterium]|nr:glycosyltransferase family 2 protein [Gemmatimonadaceae bacterium]
MYPADVVTPLLVGTGGLCLLATGYLARLAIAARPLPAVAPSTRWRFDVIIPAHNEEVGLPATLASVSGLDYPRENMRIVVVADNCTDGTSEIARAAGVTVLERVNDAQRGKGYALAHAFAWSAEQQWADAVVVIDADSTVSEGFLSAVAAQLEAGADAVQADYRVRNVDARWRTQLLELAFTLHHTVRSLGRARLGVSCGLRGNGMAFRHSTLTRVPYAAFSVVEDIEYGILLGLSGVRVVYAPDADVRGDMPETGGEAARAQRERWEVGRRSLRAKWTAPLWRVAWRPQPYAADLLADLLVPPLAVVAVTVLAGLTVSSLAILAGVSRFGIVPWIFSAVALLVYIVQGIRLTGDPGASLRALARAPIYIVWKMLGRRRSAAQQGEWVRTARASES